MWILAAIHWPSMFTRQRAPCFTNILTKSRNLCEGKYHTPSQTEKLRFRKRKGLVQGHSLVRLPLSGQSYNLDLKASSSPFAWFLPCDLLGQGLGMPMGLYLQDLPGLRQRAREVNLPRGDRNCEWRRLLRLCGAWWGGWDPEHPHALGHEEEQLTLTRHRWRGWENRLLKTKDAILPDYGSYRHDHKVESMVFILLFLHRK